MWIIKWRTQCGVTTGYEIDCVKALEVGELTSTEREAVEKSIHANAEKQGLPVDGFIDVIDSRREYVIDPQTLGGVTRLTVLVDYILGTFEDKLQLNKFKLANSTAMKQCLIVED